MKCLYAIRPDVLNQPVSDCDSNDNAIDTF